MAKSSATAEVEDQQDDEVQPGSTDAALADSEGRDRTDGNDLMTDLPQARMVVTNLSDAQLRGVGMPVGGAFVAEPQKVHKDAEKYIERFAKLAHVKKGEVLSFNPVSLVGVTANGGKYQMNKKGTQLRHMAGPVPDGAQSDKDQAEQERLEREANRDE